MLIWYIKKRTQLSDFHSKKIFSKTFSFLLLSLNGTNWRLVFIILEFYLYLRKKFFIVFSNLFVTVTILKVLNLLRLLFKTMFFLVSLKEILRKEAIKQFEITWEPYLKFSLKTYFSLSMNEFCRFWLSLDHLFST